MIKSYFENVTTAEELKKAFHEWVKKLHPDNGGDIEAFKAMKAEYERLASSKTCILKDMEHPQDAGRQDIRKAERTGPGRVRRHDRKTFQI